MTELWRPLVPLGDRGFYWANCLLVLAAGVAGFEFVLSALRWRNRWLPRLFFLTSPAQVLGLVSGNPSNVLLLGTGAATLLLARQWYFLGGLLLGTAWIKPPVGFPVAVALIIGFPGGRARAAAGALTGTVAFAILNLAVAGPGRIAQWIVSIVPYSQALSPHSQSLPSQCCLASLPAVLFGFMPV